MPIFHRIILSALLIAILTLPAGSLSSSENNVTPAPSDYGPVIQKISKLITKEMNKHDIIGMSIALVDDQKTVWADGFGFADKTNKIPASAETVYRVGSVSKLFTATLAMKMMEEGRLDIEKPLLTYIPEFSIKSRFPNAAPITLHSIMTHHSGLPVNFAKGMWSGNPGPVGEVIKRLKDEYTAFPPGMIFSYSNLGFALLGHAIERAAGRDFASYIDEELLMPLGMTQSSFKHGPEMKRLMSKGYRDEKETEEPLLRDLPAGGLYSNALDLGRFMQMVFAGGRAGESRIIKQETLAEMLRPQNGNAPLDLGFRTGLGWMLSGIDIQNAGTVAHHNGATLLFYSQLIVLSDQKIGVAVLANTFEARRAVNAVAVEALKLALEARSGIKQPEKPEHVDADKPLPNNVLGAYEGWYATMAGPVRIWRKSDGLQAEFMNKTFRLVPRDDGLLRLKYRLLGLIPIKLGEIDHVGISRDIVAGREILKASIGGRELLIGEKIKPAQVPASWTARTGEYEITNPDEGFPIENIRIRGEDGLMFVEYSLPAVTPAPACFALKPLSDDEAVLCGLGYGMGETIRAVSLNGAEGLYYSGYIMKKKTKK